MKAKFIFDIIDSEYAVALDHFCAKEQVSEPFLITAELVSEQKINLKEVIKKEGLLSISGKNQAHLFAWNHQQLHADREDPTLLHIPGNCSSCSIDAKFQQKVQNDPRSNRC